MYDTRYTGLKSAAKCAALLLALAVLHACSSGENTRDVDPPPPPTEPSGLDARPANATCLAWDRPSAGNTICCRATRTCRSTRRSRCCRRRTTTRAGSSSSRAASCKHVRGREYPATSDRVHRHHVARRRPAARWACSAWRSTRSSRTDPRVFLSYTNGDGSPLVSRISSFRSSDNGATLDTGQRADPAARRTSRRTITTAATSRSAQTATCTSASATAAAAATSTAPYGNGQRLTTMLGKMLRIDVGGAAPLHRAEQQSVLQPANPDHCPAGRPRQRQLPGDLRVGLPQSVALELRSRQRRAVGRRRRPGRRGKKSTSVIVGGNYGWRCREGAHNFNTTGTPACWARR